MVILNNSTTNNVSWFAVFEAVVDEIREKSRNFVIWISQNFDDFLWFFFKSSALAVQIWLCINSKQDWLMSSMPTKWHDQIPTFRPIAVSPDLPVIWSEHTHVQWWFSQTGTVTWVALKLKKYWSKMHTILKACQTGQYHAQVERKALKSELPRCNLNIRDFFVMVLTTRLLKFPSRNPRKSDVLTILCIFCPLSVNDVHEKVVCLHLLMLFDV